jgi:hypothetical protein
MASFGRGIAGRSDAFAIHPENESKMEKTMGNNRTDFIFKEHGSSLYGFPKNPANHELVTTGTFPFEGDWRETASF